MNKRQTINSALKLHYQKVYAPFDFPDDFAIHLIYEFGIPESSGIFLHRHNFLEIGCCLKGTGKVVVGDKKFPYQKGSIVVVNSQEYHNVISHKRTKSEWVFIDLDPGRLLSDFNGVDFSVIDFETWHGPRFKNILNSRNNGQLGDLFFKIVSELKIKGEGYEFLTKCFVSGLLYEIARTIKPGERNATIKMQSNKDTIASAMAYMENHYSEKIDVSRLATLCSTGLRNFERVFRRLTHVTPTGHWNRVRIKAATDLLSSTTYPIIEISNLIGYQTLCSFNSRFIKTTGMQPRKWRKKHSIKNHNQTGKTGPGSMTVLRFAHTGNTEEIKTHIRMKIEFEKENPDIKILFERSHFHDFFDRLMASMSTNNPPDVAYMGSDRQYDFFRKDVFLPLDDYLSKDPELKVHKFYKKTIEMFSYQGRLHILPRDIATFSCVYYNKTMFEKEGVPLPSENWTLDEFIKTAKKFVRLDDHKNPLRYGIGFSFWINILFSLGGRFVDNPFNPGQFLFTSPKSLNALQFINKLVQEHCFSPAPADNEDYNKDKDVLLLFLAGKSAMMCTGIWDAPLLSTQAKFDWDITLFPEYTKGVGGTSSGYGICKGTKYPDQAWKAIRFFAGLRGQKIMAESGLIQPAIQELAHSKYLFESINKSKNVMILDKAVEYLIPAPRLEEYDDFSRNIIDLNVNMYLGNKINITRLKSNIDSAVRQRFPWLEIP